MNHQEVLDATVAFVQDSLKNAEGGHDWWHMYRVWRLTRTIAAEEKVDLLVAELGALLHDIADAKFHNGNDEIGPQRARDFLRSIGVGLDIVDHVENIIRHISFKGGAHMQTFRSLELDVVQDADRLEALGAIGIARTFNYGGFKGRPIYDPTQPPKLNMTADEYRTNPGPTINHFYEKLLLLKNRMNTKTGKAIAEQRHAYMEGFLKQFYAEWEGQA